jgi:hypothetical protein
MPVQVLGQQEKIPKVLGSIYTNNKQYRNYGVYMIIIHIHTVVKILVC